MKGECGVLRNLHVNVVIGLVVFAVMFTAFGGLVEAATSTYSVQPGDSWWTISKRFHTSISELKRLNNYWSNTLYVGQKLKVPTTTVSQSWTYIVKSGDSLWKIAQATGASVTAIKNANNLYTNELMIGQKLLIPTGSPSTPKPEGITFSAKDIELLARLIHAESWGESYLGQVAVGAVIVNRVEDSRFPNSIEGVAYQQYAFESVSNGYIWKITPNDSTYRAAKAAINGEDPTNGALYFFNPNKMTNPKSWIWTREVTISIGDHNFAI